MISLTANKRIIIFYRHHRT